MKLRFAFLYAIAFPFLAMGVCSCSSTYQELDNGVALNSAQGKLTVTVPSPGSIRVQCVPQDIKLPQLEELVYTENPKNDIKVNITTKGNNIILMPDKGNLGVRINPRNGKLTFIDADNNVILDALPISAILRTEAEPLNYLSVSQSFRTSPDEFIFGTGQFQDGYLNIRGLSRRLTQVNTQISIPMIISNKGYGILWNNYGLTEYNPSDFFIELQQGGSDGTSVTVNATGTAGNVRERRFFNDFSGEIEVKESGDYSILLDVGQSMARKHLLTNHAETSRL